MTSKRVVSALSTVAACFILSIQANATEVSGSTEILWRLTSRPEAVRAVWTSERFFEARPVSPTYEVTEAAINESEAVSRVEPTPPRLFGRAGRGIEQVHPEVGRRLFPQDWLDRRERSRGFGPKAQGASKLPFSSSRLTPLSAEREYPYRAIGKLFS